MSWSKLKTIVICILALLNLFLLGLVGMNRLRAGRYRTAALSEAVAVLARNNIAVADALPGEMRLAAVTAVRDMEKEEQLARALLGEDVGVSASGGGMYVYRSEAGTADFRSNGEFTVTFTQPMETAQNQPDSPQALMKALGLRVWQEWEEGETVTAAQSLNGAPVYSAGSAGQITGVSYTFDGQGRLSAVSGRIFPGKLTADQEAEEPLSVPTALIAFFNFLVDSGDVCREIYGMTPVYRAATAGDPVRLMPAWRFATDTGDYFLDACTAEVTRAAG